MADTRIAGALAAAEDAVRAGRYGDAERAWTSVLTLDPGNPRALNALGNYALADNRASDALTFYERATVADPNAAPIWLNIAIAAAALGFDDRELAALDRSLVADPYFAPAMLQRGRWMEQRGRNEEALRTYRALVSAAPPLDRLPPGMRQAIERVAALVRASDEKRDEELRAALTDLPEPTERFSHCLDVLAGRRKVFVQQPIGLHFPYLPAVQFFDPALFPWFSRLEAETALIYEEYNALTKQIASNPYVQVPAGQPINQWSLLNNSLDWGALFLWKDGRRDAKACAVCPRTAALVGTLPLFDIPDRAPTVMLSILEPHTHIPPHTGVTNIRAVVHLPLVVPSGCRFRVGSETRDWRVGKAWAFDDTIEHEAWNDSDERRVILIIDCWNPFLTDDERILLSATTQLLAGYRENSAVI